jgi:predicted RNase H-like HicB family nuclease
MSQQLRPDHHYSLVVEWDPEDEIYIATVPELPGCRTHGSTYEDAVRNAQDAINSWLDAARAWGTPIPAPRVAASR